MDPIADLFTRIANAYRRRKATVVMPHSNLKAEIAKVLEAKGYLAGVEKKGRKVRKFLELKLRYDGTTPALAGLRRISKPSRRVYFGRDEIRPVRQGRGTLIISTPRGVMPGEEARRVGVGGETIAEVW